MVVFRILARLAATAAKPASLAGLVLACSLAWGQASIAVYPRFKAFDQNTGAFLAGGKLYSYLCGTSTPKATYTAQDGLTANANPVILDGSGEADVWLGSGCYKFVLADAFDVVMWTADNIQGPAPGSFTTISATSNASLAAVSATSISASSQITSTVSTGVAPLVIASTTKVSNLNADQLDGADWAAPAALGSTTPASVSATTISTTDSISTTGAGKCHTIITANGAEWRQCSISEEITLSTVGTTTDSAASLLPANSIIEAVVARVTQSITVATDWKLGDSAQAARFTAAQSGAQLNLGATVVGLNHADPTVATADLGPVQSSAAPLRITTTGTPSAGKIRVSVFYRQFVAPTS